LTALSEPFACLVPVADTKAPTFTLLDELTVPPAENAVVGVVSTTCDMPLNGCRVIDVDETEVTLPDTLGKVTSIRVASRSTWSASTVPMAVI
jgi:hypothetical protein